MPIHARIFGRTVKVRSLVDYYPSDYLLAKNEMLCSVTLYGGPMVVDLPYEDVLVSLGHTHNLTSLGMGDDVPCEWLTHCPSYCNCEIETCLTKFREVV